MFISIWTRALLCLSLLNVIKEYYDHEGFWVIVKNFDVTHSRLPKQRKYKTRPQALYNTNISKY